MKKNQTDTVVIGSGLTGLTSAYYLNKARKSFIVIDKAEKTGGVIKTSQRDGFIFEEGPNTCVIGNTSVVELFEELAGFSEVELGNKDAAKRYILKKGKWHQLPSSLMTGITTPLFSFYDKIRILGELFRKKGDNPHENLSSFVRRRLGKSFLDYAIDPFILGVYAGDPSYIIPKYALPKLYNLEQEYGSLIGGSFKKQFAPKSALEKRVSRKVFSFKNGLSSLTDALYNKVGEEHFLLISTIFKLRKR
jgi:oxygen-dependent protoporphyrinogen oxidase